MEDSSPNAGTRQSLGGKTAYHHGDLRNALIDAATGLARSGGPDAVVLRAAARRVGVSPTAAYRHFAGQSDLLGAVKVRGQQTLATWMADAAASAAPEGEDAVEQRMIAMGRGYIAFALEEPGLFRSAFCDHLSEAAVDVNEAGVPMPEAGAPGFGSFQLLIDILDGLVAVGRMPPERRPGAEITAWSMVHGLATLLLDDAALEGITAEQRDAAVDRALHTLVAGFTAP
ncbi:TetR/AcrR family transcriptional regulator [Streptomyces sp. N2-109]|uniref:TetR/AcrR family transcriptional regulator n=1 Tax=Streptomyces gossypii TaxID=2883101 RepID=A0ABT2JWK2_9ACTN|nr:TetR/AcrR family transcriptional regulator [Streptomyces gossypii]MCT2591700.1 TetR/AcrR family transcriptional regulator [Streptomyces gossypii]